jgi:membrane fusion protein, multidrug efflux system
MRKSTRIPIPDSDRRTTIMNKRSIFFGLGLAVAVAVGAYLYFTNGRYIGTDNAYLKFDKVTLSAEVSGTITALLVKENQQVQQGALLATIDDASYRVALEKANARVKQSESNINSLKAAYHTKQAELAMAVSNLDYANTSYQRELNLAKKKLTSDAVIDDRRHSLDVASERKIIIEKELARLLANLDGRADAPINEYSEVIAAQADVSLAQINLQRTRILAPFDGFVSHLPKVGQHIDIGSPVLSLVSDKNFWVEANFKETELDRLQLNQAVDITVDAYPDLHWRGSVESVGAATGSEYSILPPQNATGNWIKVVQRVPVRIKVHEVESGPVLRAGMSVYVKIDTRPSPT